MVRLQGGADDTEGRIEVRLPGRTSKDYEWATVCDIDFTLESAMVICQQLGHREV